MKNGFTLIELLVVVLIIGILAAVSLPMYTRNIERARCSEAWINLKAVMDAQERSLLQSQRYVPGDAGLDIGIDGTLDTSKAWDAADQPIVTNNFIYHFKDESVVADRQPGNKFYLEYWYANAEHQGKGPRGCFAYTNEHAPLCEEMYGEMWGPVSGGFYYKLPD